jgi:AcrR family transcriptional regulator
MARPKIGDKKAAILTAAIELIAQEGVGATTAQIAERAGVAHGSVFHHFGTKADLFNVVFLQLKQEIHVATLRDLPDVDDPFVQLKHLWVTWMEWGKNNPIRCRATSRLAYEQVITKSTRDMVNASMERGIRIVQTAAAGGVFKDQPIEFVGRFFDALGEATIDAMVGDPERSAEYCELSFQALRRALE